MTSIVVVGGGLVGITALRELEKRVPDAEIILVETREYLEVSFAMPRALMEPTGLGKTMRAPYTSLTQAKHLRFSAQQIVASEVVLEDGNRLPFDYAIVSTGSFTKGAPFIKGHETHSIDDRLKELAARSGQLADSKNLLIIGGGPIGVELAGEVADRYSDKKITLAHASDRLLPALPEKAGHKAAKKLRELGVHVLLNTRVEAKNGTYLVQGSNESFGSDVVIMATGIQTKGIPVDGDSSLNDKNQLRVDHHLRVVGRENVFAVGDVNDVAEIKLAATGGRQAALAVKNIAKLLRGKSGSLGSYKPSPPMGFVTLGRKAGIAQLPFGRLDFLVAIKQRDMMVSRTLGKAR